MIMKDFVSSTERLKFMSVTQEELYPEECTGCGRTAHDIVKDEGCTYEQLEWTSKSTNSGLWYCHDDCYRDSH